MNRNQIISDVYQIFVENFRSYITEMRECEQGESFENPSPYHLEGDVWAHTLCCYTHGNNAFNMCGFDETNGHEYKLLHIAILFHDIGKPTTMDFHESGKKYFRGHDGRSMQIMMNHWELICEVFGITKEDLIELMLIVQVHTLYYQLKDPKDIFKYLNHNHQTFRLYSALSVADVSGQIRSTFDGNDAKFDITKLLGSEVMLPFPKEYDNERKFIIFSGCPASGKDYYASGFNYIDVILSWDDIRLELFLAANPDSTNDSYAIQYRKAFHWCNDQKIDLLQITQKRVNKAYSGGATVVAISNVNLTKKARKSLLGIARNCKATPHSVYILSHLPTLIERDITRAETDDKGKTVSDKIITGMYFNQFLSTQAEGFDSISYIFN